MTGISTTTAGFEELVTVIVLVTEFAMLRAPLLRSQVRLYAFQSFSVCILAIVVAVTRHEADVYALAGFTFALKVVIIPSVMMRLLPDVNTDLTASPMLSAPSMTFIALGVTVFGFFTAGAFELRSSVLPAPIAAVSVAIVLVAFVLIVLRSDAVSQAVGFFSLENGVSITSLVMAAGLPLVIDVTFLFDLLVAVVAFGIIMRLHHGRSQTLLTDVLDRLRG